MKTKLVSVVLTAVILVVLVLSGPANAFSLGFNISNSTVTRGDKTSLIVSFDLTPNEQLNVSYVLLTLDGFKKDDFACKFNFNGSVISGCNGISIVKMVHNESFGYGYGYGNIDRISYNLTLDSSKFPSDKYKTSIDVKSGKNIITKKGDPLVITFISKGLDGCSIRAKNGLLTLDNKTFTNSKLNFFIQTKNAVKSTGTIYGQVNRTTFSYDFTTDQVLENDNNHAVILVVGNYALGIGKKLPETAMITFNKITKKISISGEHINAQNLSVTFDQKC